MYNFYTYSLMLLRLKSRLFFNLIILLVSCLSWGQANKNMQAYLEDDRLLLNISPDNLNVPMLFVRHDVGYHQVIWTTHEDHLILTIPQIESSSGVTIPLHHNYRHKASIIGRFPIIDSQNNTDHFKIDITDFILNTNLQWPTGSPPSVIANLSYVDGVQHLNNETIIITQMTSMLDHKPITNEVSFSFYLLPEPMEPRLFDHRMGFSSEDPYDIMNSIARTPKANISRWRLEKTHKEKEMSTPKQPIVFYFDSITPHKWKPYIKAGIMEWLPAFEAAGFKNAIVVKDAPVDDPNWNPNSMNYSMIRWKNYSGIRGSAAKSGSTVTKIVDFRSGEILKSDIIFASSFQSLSDEYLVRCAPLDSRAQQYPFPDDLMGELIQFIIAHEAGHAFGIKDAHYGEYAYPFKKMRDIEWLDQMGHTPSIMSYARHNYIVQPEDHIPPDLLIQKAGPADRYQIQWGYQTYDHIPMTEVPSKLEQLVRLQEEVPWYAYHNAEFGTIGPASTDEVVDNDNPIESTALGLKNIKRVIELLPKINYKQKDNSNLKRLYKKTLELWHFEMEHVLSLIGGYTIHYKSGSQKGAVYAPVPAHLQLEAMDFLIANAFEVPDWLSHPEFTARFQYSTDTDILMDYQLMVLAELVSPYRMKRLENMEDKSEYKDLNTLLMSRLTKGIFNKMLGEKAPLNRHRQELQIGYLNLIIDAVEQDRTYSQIRVGENNGFYTAQSKRILNSELYSLKQALSQKLDEAKTRELKYYLELCLDQIVPKT